jgi:hypothetical protein
MSKEAEIKIEEIKPYQKNAKKHPQKQIKQIADSISKFGFNQPLVIDEKKVIIVGHGRYEAAKILLYFKINYSRYFSEQGIVSGHEKSYLARDDADNGFCGCAMGY